MSLARMSAGAGYRYLLRHTATGDVERAPGVALVAYYAASGNPPGRWVGAGLPGLGAGDGKDLTTGTVVSEEAMARLFGSGRDPVTGQALGRPYPTYKPVAKRIAARVGRLPDDLSEGDRTAALADIDTQERARPVRSAVAGYDLTFTAPKSVSVLWALGDEQVRTAIEAAHHDAVAAVLGLVEERFLHTRIGAGSLIQVPARGAIAAAFDHWDTRAGDPNLHTHLVIANKVQGPDGQWRAVDGRALYSSAVACSEIYDSVLADLLATRLPVRFGYRDRGPRRTPTYEIDGIPGPLLAAFSTRSQAITTHVQDLVAAFVDTHGRAPDRIETIRLRQQATLATRPEKHVAPLAQLRDRWRATAQAVTGQPAGAIVSTALTSMTGGPSNISATRPATGPAEISDALLDRYADATVTAVSTRRATWTQTNLLAEAARITRALRVPDSQARVALLDRVVSAALDRCIPLDPPETAPVPARYTDLCPDARPARSEEPAFTTWATLAAEARLLAAHDDICGPTADPAPARAAAEHRMPGAPRLSADQARAAATIAASGRRLDLLIGAAGSGKTRALYALRATWELTHGAGTVIGLAPSAAAAAELATALHISADTVAKWIYESDPASATGTPWQLRAGQLVIVDEAAMASTAHLDALTVQAAAAGAKMVLVGDQHQLGSVDAGGAFALLADHGTPVELETPHRFTHTWEAEASRALRLGDPVALDALAAHGRVHGGAAEAMIESAYRAWAADLATGRSSLLLAHDRVTVAQLNRRAQGARVRSGEVDPDGVALHDGTTAGRGDHIVTRRNDRRLPHADGTFVRNGERWTVEQAHPDGSLTVTQPVTDRPPSGPAAVVQLPADYVRAHVELGYAGTIHRAQGSTVDTAHTVAAPGLSRQALYVALTRGREANHAYAVIDHPDQEVPAPDLAQARAVLARILATDSAATSATARFLRHRDPSKHLQGPDASARIPAPARRRPSAMPMAPPSRGPEPPGAW
ncbi:MAG: MobF family relaxase [Sporichthyaceae bacterium]